MELGRDIYIEESHVRSVASHFREEAIKIDNFILEYTKILEIVKQEAVSQGEFSEKISIFSEQVKMLEGVMGEIMEKLTTLLSYYMYAMDDADEDLY